MFGLLLKFTDSLVIVIVQWHPAQRAQNCFTQRKLCVLLLGCQKSCMTYKLWLWDPGFMVIRPGLMLSLSSTLMPNLTVLLTTCPLCSTRQRISHNVDTHNTKYRYMIQQCYSRLQQTKKQCSQSQCHSLTAWSESEQRKHKGVHSVLTGISKLITNSTKNSRAFPFAHRWIHRSKTAHSSQIRCYLFHTTHDKEFPTHQHLYQHWCWYTYWCVGNSAL